MINVDATAASLVDAIQISKMCAVGPTACQALSTRQGIPSPDFTRYHPRQYPQKGESSMLHVTRPRPQTPLRLLRLFAANNLRARHPRKPKASPKSNIDFTPEK